MNQMSAPTEEIDRREKSQNNKPNIKENEHFLGDQIQWQKTFDGVRVIRRQLPEREIAESSFRESARVDQLRKS